MNTICTRPFFDTRMGQPERTSTSFHRSEDTKARVALLRFLKRILSDAKLYNCYYNGNVDVQGQLNMEYQLLVTKVKKCAELEKMHQKRQMEQLFRKKGWNEVDSSFRIFGTYQATSSNLNDRQGQEWLESKGWNDVDSGFRFI